MTFRECPSSEMVLHTVWEVGYELRGSRGLAKLVPHSLCVCVRVRSQERDGLSAHLGRDNTRDDRDDIDSKLMCLCVQCTREL